MVETFTLAVDFIGIGVFAAMVVRLRKTSRRSDPSTRIDHLR
jgi:hypothetical protein